MRNRSPLLSKARATRDRSRAVLKSRLRNAYRKVEITLNSNNVGVSGIGEAEGIYRRWRRRRGEERGGTRSGGWFPPSQAGNSKVGTATTGEAKSVRVMGHRHAISRVLSPSSLPTFCHPCAILTFNFAHGSPEPPSGPPPSVHLIPAGCCAVTYRL